MATSRVQMREGEGLVLVSSRAETLNKAIAAGSQKVNVDCDANCDGDCSVVRQPDYARVWTEGGGEVAELGLVQGHDLKQPYVCVCVSIRCKYVFILVCVCYVCGCMFEDLFSRTLT